MKRRFTLPLLFALFTLLLPPAHAEEDLLPPEEAFKVTVTARDATRLSATWQIADGYYLYRSKFRFSSDSSGVTLGSPTLPAGVEKQDEFFGRLEIYRQSVTLEIPLQSSSRTNPITLKLTSQGCADVGVCYPPYTHTVKLTLPPLTPQPPQSIREPAKPPLTLAPSNTNDEPLAPEVAFPFTATVRDGQTIETHWNIAPQHYLYRDKITFAVEGDGVTLQSPAIPPGEEKEDEFLGRVQVLHNFVEVPLTLTRQQGAAQSITLRVGYQGCAEAGICYPPQKQQITLELPPLTAAPVQTVTPPPSTAAVPPAPAAPPLSEQDDLAQSLASGSLFSTLLLFFGLGLLLAFTPCVFPMIPILSSIIVGQGEGLTTRRAFILSLVYVLAMALTYTVAGVLAGLFGANLQAAFQNPWILGSFSALFVVLSLSMFGFYELQLPSHFQSRLAILCNRQQGGTLIGVAIMGLLSALIVGPCVAPPLMGALIYIGQSGDALLGGLALFALSLGMGAPLLLIGTSAGSLLPRAGGWMEAVKAVFGVLLLAVAIWMLERILPAWLSMLLWAVLLLLSAIYMGALEPIQGRSGWAKLWKGLGVLVLVQAVLILIGVAMGHTDPLQPLKGAYSSSGATATAPATHLTFQRIKSLDDLHQALATARSRQQTVMLDFYADWCVSCKEMEKYTFSDPTIVTALKETVLLQADVTANDATDQALLKAFNLIGPPAILFFNRDGVEQRPLRVVGYLEAAKFLTQIRQAFP